MTRKALRLQDCGRVGRLLLHRVGKVVQCRAAGAPALRLWISAIPDRHTRSHERRVFLALRRLDTRQKIYFRVSITRIAFATYICYDSRMNSDATPCPVLAHMLTMPISLSCRRSSPKRVAVWRAPVAPVG